MNSRIDRNPSAAQDATFDLVVIGAGIQGAAAALAAARGGRRVLLLDRGDFGGETSWNSLRILHGGLRYLREFDLTRFRRSVEARSWFVEEFPELIAPLPCVMPLYGQGARRRATMGPALMLNEWLRRRWGSTAENDFIAPGRLLSNDEVIGRFPAVRSEGLRGGALWFDAVLTQPQRVLIEILRRAAGLGAQCLNYVEATGWEVVDGRIAAVRARDVVTDRELEFRADTVMNCAGPWSAGLAADDDPVLARSFHPALAFNLLLARGLDSDAAVAVEPAGGGRTYFLLPMAERTLAGTFHAPLEGNDWSPSATQVETFLADLRAAIPGFDVGPDDVLRIMPGVLPAAGPREGTTATRSLTHTAADGGGPAGLRSLVAVKYTTAPLTAADAVAAMSGSVAARSDLADRSERPRIRLVPGWAEMERRIERDPEAAKALIDAIVREESVLRPDDLLLRRTDWGLDPRDHERAVGKLRRLRPELFGAD